MDKIYTDFLGREILVGDEVVYPGRRGAHLWMNYGYIEIIGDGRVRVRRTPLSVNEKDRSVWVEDIKRMVVVR